MFSHTKFLYLQYQVLQMTNPKLGLPMVVLAALRMLRTFDRVGSALTTAKQDGAEIVYV